MFFLPTPSLTNDSLDGMFVRPQKLISFHFFVLYHRDLIMASGTSAGPLRSEREVIKRKMSGESFISPRKKTRKGDNNNINNNPLLQNYEQERLSTKEMRLLNEILEGKKDKYFIAPTFHISNEFRRILLYIATQKITPGIVAYISIECLFDTLYDDIDDDKTFIILSLLVGINNGFFSKSYDMFAAEGNGTKAEEDVMKIKNRWRILDALTDKIEPATTVRRLINVVAYFIRKRLFKKLIKHYIALSSGGGDSQQPFDVSFTLPMIDKANFDQVSKLVKENVLIFFNPVIHQYYKNAVEARSKHIKSGSGMGKGWKKERNSTLRNFMINKVIDNEIDERDYSLQNIEEQAQSFEDLLEILDLTQCSDVIKQWRFPYSVLMCVLKKSFERLLTLEKKGCRCFGKVGKYFGWLTERAMEENKSNDHMFHDYVKMIIRLNDIESFTEIVKRCNEIRKIKEYARYIVSETRSHTNLLNVLLEKFPWLLNTWIDYKGNTLLGLCVIHNYLHLRALMDIPSVKKYVDVESIDGLTPLMLAADYPRQYYIINDLIEKGCANPIYVNRYHESILHRLAASNNCRGVENFRTYPCNAFCHLIKNTILELRRKGDGATALMLALSRDNVDVADAMMRLLGATARTKFGNSQTLRTAEAVYLLRKNMSVALLMEMGIHPETKIIANSFKSGALFEQECFVATTGVENNSRVCDVVYRGDITKRLESAGLSKKNNRVTVVCVDDLNWTLFNNHGYCKKLKWANCLLNNNKEGLEKAIKDDSGKDFGNQECPVCLDDFSGDEQKGVTKCGHSFHSACWAGVLEKEFMKKCPMCRAITTLSIQEYLEFSPEPTTAVIAAPKMRKYRRKREDEEKEGIWLYNKIARYEFFIDGKWVDESLMHV